METSKTIRALQLDLALGRIQDDRGPDIALDAETTATLRHLHELAARPVPDSSFVHSLGQRLSDAAIIAERAGYAAPEAMVNNSVILSGMSKQPCHGGVGQPRRVQRPSGCFRPSSGRIYPPEIGPTSSPCRPRAMHQCLERPLRTEGPPVRANERPILWWQPRLAVAVLIVALLGGYLAIANLGRTITSPRPAHLGAIAALTDEGAFPMQLRIDAIEVGASIEGIQPIRGDVATPTAGDIWTVGWRDDNPIAVPEPSGPWDVAWQDDSPAPGDGSNVVLRGHLDYWDTNEAVFGDLNQLTEGDRIQVTRDDGDVFAYAVEWSRRFPIDAGEDEQRDILGPTTGESLTLMTSAGAFDRETMNYPEVLIVRARFLGSTSLRTMFVPDPAECQGTPRTIAELEAATARLLSAPYPAATPTSVADKTGSVVDAATMAAVIAAERELVACLNASDALRTYALYTDAGLERLLRWSFPSEFLDPIYEFTPDFSQFSTPTPPRPDTEWLALSAVEDVRLLPDGRIAALVTIGPGSADMLGVPTDVPVLHIFAPGERLLIDDFVVPSLGATAGS